MKKAFKKALLVGLLTLLPSLGFAQIYESVRSANELVRFVYDVINTLIPLIIAIALLFFIWGVYRYVVSPSEEDKARGKQVMIWGIVGIFVMVSVWGLVNILDRTFKLDKTIPDFPQVPYSRGSSSRSSGSTEGGDSTGAGEQNFVGNPTPWFWNPFGN